jgi:tripeptidyl-peptidase-1
MNLLFLSLLALLALEAGAEPLRKATSGNHCWQRKFLAPRNGRIKLHIALRQQDNGAEVERELLSISDPASPRYRQHISAEHAASLSNPAHGSVHYVESWLWKHGLLKDASLFGGIYEIDTTIRNAEKLLNTTYFVWSDGQRDVVRTELFYLPDSVAGHIDFVAPTTVFPKAKILQGASKESKSRYC